MFRDCTYKKRKNLSIFKGQKMKSNKIIESYIEVNLLENRYVTDGDIWTVDETIFNSETMLYLVINIKTRAILGYILHNDCKNDDLIIELYEKILQQYKFNKPVFVHSDTEPEFTSKKVREYLDKKGIKVSTTKGKKNQNQLSESINEQIKMLTTLVLLEKETSDFKNWRKNLNPKFKNLRKVIRAKSTEFRKELFKSNYFTKCRLKAIPDAIKRFNDRLYIDGISRQQAEYYNTKIVGKTLEDVQLLRSDDEFAQALKNSSVIAIKAVEQHLRKIMESDQDVDNKLTNIAALVVSQNLQIQGTLQRGFIGLATQNQELKDTIDQMDDRIKQLLLIIEENQREKLEKEKRRRARQNRKIQPSREPITQEIYQSLMDATNDYKRNNTYLRSRLRIALTILFVTGIRISELLPLKVSQLRILFKEYWIAIDRVKRGKSSHKAYLTKLGTRVINKIKSDFETITYYKDDSSYIFTAEHSPKPLERSQFTHTINMFIKEQSEKMDGKPILTSHSFRKGFITKLWRDTSDIEFVRQAIGHAKINTTSVYVENLSEQERRERMQQIQDPKDLIL